jgi:hypothetical protein
MNNYRSTYSIDVNKGRELFLRKYEAQGRTSPMRYARRIPVSYRSWDDTKAPLYDSLVDHEPMVELHIPQHRFDELIERDEYLTRVERELDYNQKVVNMLREDERVRDQNAAVQKAYKNYLMLLELARK